MVNNVIHATYTETYDFNTINNELSLLAIHTPQSMALKRMFKGFFEQYRKFKILGCNLRMVCASQQSLTPDLVGLTEGKVDPRDVLNPILFKACTGESMNALLDQIYNSSQAIHSGNITGHSIDQHLDSRQDALSAYYALLADDSFRREHPQKGLTVMGLRPKVHRIVSTQPFKWTPHGRNDGIDSPLITGSVGPAGVSNGVPAGFGGQSGSNVNTEDPVNPSVFVSNGLTEMPWLDTAYSLIHSYTDDGGTDMGNAKAYSIISNVPRVYMGCIVLPPSILQNLYFRCQIVWHLQFKDFRPSQDLLPVTAPGPVDTSNPDAPQLGDSTDTYFIMYHTPSKLAKDYGSIDTQGVEDVSIVNEKVA